MGSIVSHVPKMKKRIREKSLNLCYTYLFRLPLPFFLTRKTDSSLFIHSENILDMARKHSSKPYVLGARDTIE